MALSTAEDLREHRDALAEVEAKYREYVEAQKGNRSDLADRSGWLSERRAYLMRCAARADRAVAASGYTFALSPPPLLGGPVLHHLAQQMFAHETSLYGSGEDPFMTTDMVLDGIASALGALDDKIDVAGRPSPYDPQPMRRNTPRSRTGRRRLRGAWGRLTWVPTWVGFAADVVTVGGIVLAAMKLVGVI
jgi:hypothetical protein